MQGLAQVVYEQRRSLFIAVVRIGSLGTYIREHLMPFAEEAGHRAVKHHVELAGGAGVRGQHEDTSA